MTRTVPFALAVIATLLVATAVAGAATEPVDVVATAADEYNPAASADHIAWDVITRNGQISYVRPLAGGPRMRVSRVGLAGSTGAIDGTSLIYQQFSLTRPRSDIFTFDLTTGERMAVGAPINTERWEYFPGMAGDRIIFARLFPDGDRKLYLYSRSGGTLRTVATTRGPDRVLYPGQVNGDHIAYSILAWRNDRLIACESYRYDITDRTTERLPNPNDRCQTGTSVDPAGTVYFVRSGFGCGASPSLRSYTLDGVTTTLFTPESGDIANTYAVDNGDGTYEIYLDPYRCKKDGSAGVGDITALTAP